MIQIESKFNPGEEVNVVGMENVVFVIDYMEVKIKRPSIFPRRREDGGGFYFNTSFGIEKQYKLIIRSEFATTCVILEGWFSEGSLKKIEKQP